MVMNISIGLVDLLALDTTSYGCGGLIRTFINSIGDKKHNPCKKMKIGVTICENQGRMHSAYSRNK